MIVLGITGGIATGKSTVTRMFAEMGAPTISADALAHQLLAPGTQTTRAVLRAFPACADPADPTVLTIDRRALGRAIFADPKARTQLEAITHPPIIAVLREQIHDWRSQPEAGIAAAEIPLLFEAGLEKLVDRVVVVACAEAAQVARLEARRGMDPAEARRRIAAQWPLAEKIARADFVIATNGSVKNTYQQTLDLFIALHKEIAKERVHE